MGGFVDIAAFSSIAPFLTNVLVLVGLVLFLLFGIHRALIQSGIIPPLEQSAAPSVVLAILRYGFWIALAMIIAGLCFYGMDKFVMAKTGSVTVKGPVIQAPAGGGDAIIGGTVNKKDNRGDGKAQ
jgi:hypothetical protein